MNQTIEDSALRIIDLWVNGSHLTEDQTVILYLFKRLIDAEKKLEEIVPTLK